MVEINGNITYNVHDILRKKFESFVTNNVGYQERFEISDIDLGKNTYFLRNLATNSVSLETLQNLQIFYIKEHIL